MKITKYSIVAIGAVLLIIGLVTYTIHDRFPLRDHLTIEDDEKMNHERYENDHREPGDLAVIATYGKLPKFENEEQKRNWYANLKEIGRSIRMRGEMDSYFHPEGSVIGYGYNREGYRTVTFLEGTVIEQPLMDEIYEIFDKQAREIGIQEVPLVFEFGEIPVKRTSN